MEDPTARPLAEAPRRSMRELLLLARERLGPRVAALKTREELEAALAAPAALQAAQPAAPARAPVIVVRDFFVRQPDGAGGP